MDVLTIETVEKLLIDAIHSNKIAREYFNNNLKNKDLFDILLKILAESESGDARMGASYRISQFDSSLLFPVESTLLIHMDDEWDSVAVHMMVALAKIKSKVGLCKIVENRIEPELAWEAECLKIYFDLDSK